MSFPLVEAALTEFERDVARARRLLELMIEFREFGSSRPPVASEDNAWPAADALYNLAQPVRTDLPVFSGSILLYLAGRFEYYIVQSVELIADALIAEAPEYGDLPEAIKRHVRAKTLEVARDPKKFRLDDAQVTKLLEDLVAREKPGAIEFNIDTRLLSMTDSNMRPDILDEVLKRVGLDGVWNELGKQTELKLYFGTTGDGPCKNAARMRLNDLMTERNDVAHPTGSTNFASAEDVLEYIRFLLLLGRSLSNQFLLYLSSSEETR